MISAKSKDRNTEVHITGDAETILNELLIITAHILKTFYTHGDADVVLEGLVDVAEEFTSSITNKNFNSKGEKKDD